MKRDYQEGDHENVTYFVGTEVEHTPAFGMETLFVVGIRPCAEISQQLSKGSKENIKHIFFGANHSFNPTTDEQWKLWEEMIQFFLKRNYLCSLDIPLTYVEEFNDGGLNEFDNFIPQIRVPIPYIRLWNYNTMIKIDDKDFRSTNPGVWSHSLHTLMDRKNFTDWNQYEKDKIIS